MSETVPTIINNKFTVLVTGMYRGIHLGTQMEKGWTWMRNRDEEKTLKKKEEEPEKCILLLSSKYLICLVKAFSLIPCFTCTQPQNID